MNDCRDAGVASTATFKTLLACSTLALALVSCDAQQPSEYHGGLYFEQGSYLMRFGLRDGSLSVEGHLGDSVIREISGLGANHLLIAESALVNRRRVPRIAWIDLETGETSDLYAGVLARYIEAADVIVYDDGSDLFAVPQKDGTANEVIFSHPQNQLTRLIEASPGVLLFETVDGDRPAIHSWDARTGELHTLADLAATCRLEGAVWIGELERLACKRRGGPIADAEYLFSDLDGTVHGPLDLPADRQFLALTYIDGQNALVLQETRRGWLGEREKYAVWVYDTRTGVSHRLAGSVNLGSSVVFGEY